MSPSDIAIAVSYTSGAVSMLLSAYLLHRRTVASFEAKLAEQRQVIEKAHIEIMRCVDPTEKIPPREGWVFEINRKFLHPLGYSLLPVDGSNRLFAFESGVEQVPVLDLFHEPAFESPILPPPFVVRDRYEAPVAMATWVGVGSEVHFFIGQRRAARILMPAGPAGPVTVHVTYGMYQSALASNARQYAHLTSAATAIRRSLEAKCKEVFDVVRPS